MRTSISLRWLVVAVSAAMLMAVAAACGGTETIEVPGETVVVEKEVVKTVEVPGQTVVKEVVKTVEVPGQTVVVEKVVTETVQVPGKTVVVEKEVVRTVEVPGETVVKEVIKEVEVEVKVPVIKEVIKVIEVPAEPAEPVAVAAEQIVDPRTGKMINPPQYGGSISYAIPFNPSVLQKSSY